MSMPVLKDGKPGIFDGAPLLDTEGDACCDCGGGEPECDCDACPTAITIVVDIEVYWEVGNVTFISGTWVLTQNTPFGSCIGYGNGNEEDTLTGTIRCEDEGGDFRECDLVLPSLLNASKAICFTPGFGTPTPPAEYGTCGAYPAWMLLLRWGTSGCTGDGCSDECGICVAAIRACAPLDGYGDCPGDVEIDITYPTDTSACGCGNAIDSVVVNTFSVT